ncbi:hypothetical protein HHL22_14385 [Hymenobacter sp. RP-2-7]|uniref:S9 family peptidase n=1 Tax=Hymenobacter polaris TaxID=2682546 RepID=A0A7Y0AFJ9_9BACT|nr:hypothetical protein [Hymenobacter polaris]NML66396.1 hypothetical protein [Hymenobacter polaris]
MRVTAIGLVLAGLAGAIPLATQAQKVKTVPFSYLPEQGEDRYNMRVPQKTLALPDGSGFVILAHQSGSAYAVERYDAALKKQWSTTLPVAPGETVEAFGRNAEQVLVVLHHADDSGQNLTAYAIALAGGQKAAPVVLVQAAAADRRPVVRLSPDGTRLLAYRYALYGNQVRSLVGTLYDQRLTKILDRTYDFRDQGDFFSPNILLANDGTQYVTLLGDGMRRLTVRRYPATPDRLGVATPVPVLGVPVGGVFGGQPITIRDAKFSLLPDGQLYATALCAKDNTGELSSLKTVRFDFGANNIKLAEPVPLGGAFLAEVNKTLNTSYKRLDDVYLTDMLLTDSKNLVVMAERHFEEGGPELPVHARELYVFGYSPFLTPTWHQLLPKDQVAPAIDSYTGIGLRATVWGEEVQLLTWEAQEGKSDLYLRRLQAATGVASPLQRLKLNVTQTTTEQQPAYVKDFTTWLDPKTIITVSRPNKKSAALQLDEIKFK